MGFAGVVGFLLRLLLRGCQFRSSSHVDVDGQLCFVAIYGFAFGVDWVCQMQEMAG